MKKSVLFIVLFVAFFQFVLIQFTSLQFISADVVSVNSGGSDEIIINPDTYIEGFFSGDTPPVQVLSLCGNGIVEAPYEECDDGNTVSGDGCSYTCQNEEEGGGGGIITPEGIYLRIDPIRIRRSMLINTNIEESLGITNLNSTRINFSIYSSGFDPDLIVSFWDERTNTWVSSFSLTMAGNEIHELRIRFSAPSEIGYYNGTIFIAGIRVPVALNVQEKLLLFDSNIIVLNEDYLVPQGEKLRTSVTLIPIGDKERMDVTLNYVIKDYTGRVYLTRSETILVEDQINFKRNFDTGILPLGSYIIGLELIYANGVAPSSAHFEVILGRQSTFFGRLVFFLINIILIILILLIILIILRIIRRIIDNKKLEKKEKSLKILNPEEKPKEDEEALEKDKEKSKQESKQESKDKDKKIEGSWE